MAAHLIFTYTGGSSNSDPNLSLGGDGSSVEVIDPVPGNLFDHVEPLDIRDGDEVVYRAIDIYNDGDQEADGILWFLTDTTNSESTLASWTGDISGQEITDETTEPTGATWTLPTVSSKESLSNLAAGARIRIWIRRTVDQDAAAISPDTATMNCWFSNSV